MPTLRGATDADLQTPLLLVGGALVLFLALALFRYHELRDRRLAKQRMHEPLRIDAAAPMGTLDQISRRKQDLGRFIDRLRTQLAAREQQLQLHDELEEIVTARAETTHRQDKEWRKIMKAGKKLHGNKWDASNGDTPSLRELMEEHRDELLAYKADASEMRSARAKTTARNAARVMQLPPHALHSYAPAREQQYIVNDTSARSLAKLVSPQWQSTRRIASAVAGGTLSPTAQQQAALWSRYDDDADEHFDGIAVTLQHDAAADVTKPSAVPLLDLSKLTGAAASPANATSNNSNTSSSAGEASTKKKKKLSFAQTFQRQARLAKALKKKT